MTDGARCSVSSADRPRTEPAGDGADTAVDQGWSCRDGEYGEMEKAEPGRDGDEKDEDAKRCDEERWRRGETETEKEEHRWRYGDGSGGSETSPPPTGTEMERGKKRGAKTGREAVTCLCKWRFEGVERIYVLWR